MAVDAGVFNLPKWLDQSNTDLVPRALDQGASAGQAIAQGIRAKQELEQRLNQQKELEQQKAKIFATQQSALADYKRDIQAGMKPAEALAKHPEIFAGNPSLLGTSVDREEKARMIYDAASENARIRALGQQEIERRDTLNAEGTDKKLNQQKELFGQSLKLKEDQLAETKRKLDETLKTNQEINAGHDKTKLEAVTLGLQNKLLQNKSRIDDVTFSSFNKQAAAISNDKELTTPAKMRKIQDLQIGVEKVLADRRDAASKVGTPTQPAKPNSPDALPADSNPTNRPSGYQPAVINGMPNVTSQAERDALPKGTKYISPDGKIREKQ